MLHALCSGLWKVALACSRLEQTQPCFSSQPLHTMSFQGAIAALNELIACKPRRHVNAATVSSDVSDVVDHLHCDRTLRRMAAFQRMSDYIQTLDLEEPLSCLHVIHVAGTKGKGSTCAFVESILRSCGYRTGLFTSPHLVDVRERFRLNGVEVSEDIFCKYFWWCWNRLQAKAALGAPMPAFFPFVTLLALKIFTSEHVEVAILEVGLGGRYDATNVIKTPAVCGITSLGLDHMEILGNTLAEIASQKAGIFKAGVPAFSVPQDSEAMKVLQNEAEEVSIPLEVPPPLDTYNTKKIQLGLEGDYQCINAALAIAVCACWEKRFGSSEHSAMVEKKMLPDPYLQGLANVCWPGRAQVIHDRTVNGIYDTYTNGKFLASLQNSGMLTFYLDGAHTPESMEACAKWFCMAVRAEETKSLEGAHSNGFTAYTKLQQQQGSHCYGRYQLTALEKLSFRRVLLFNCMPKRDPQLLLPPLINICVHKGLPIDVAIFVPSFSNPTFIDTRSLEDINDSMLNAPPDLCWQKTLQQTWESLWHAQMIGSDLDCDRSTEYSVETEVMRNIVEGNHGLWHHHCNRCPLSVVISSLTAAVNFLRSWSSVNSNTHIQVLVTGSLYLVGDMLKILK